jgi:thiol-disulfide isomerase/thioredoxin
MSNLLEELLKRRTLKKVEPTQTVCKQETLPKLRNVRYLYNMANRVVESLEKQKGVEEREIWEILAKEDNAKLILVDFFAYSCTNCIRTISVLKRWNEKYYSAGLRIFAFHRPEFQFERDPINMLNFIERENINYMVALDNQDQAWNDWKVEFWPQHFLISKKPNSDFKVIYTHFGDRDHHEMEQYISRILSNDKSPIIPYNHESWYDVEIFLGVSHRRKNLNDAHCGDGVCKISFAPRNTNPTDSDTTTIEYNKNTTTGKLHFQKSDWTVSREYIHSNVDNAQLDLQITLENTPHNEITLYIVAEPPEIESHPYENIRKEFTKMENTTNNIATFQSNQVKIEQQSVPISQTNSFQTKRIVCKTTDKTLETNISHSDRHYIGNIQTTKTDNGAFLSCTLYAEKGTNIYVIYLTNEPHQ